MKSLIHQLIRILPDETLFGSSFRKAQRIAKEYEASTDKVDFINCYQEEQLKRILSIAEKAPYYKGINEYKNFEDLPFTDKNAMQQDIEAFVVDKKGADFMQHRGYHIRAPIKILH